MSPKIDEINLCILKYFFHVKGVNLCIKLHNEGKTIYANTDFHSWEHVCAFSAKGKKKPNYLLKCQILKWLKIQHHAKSEIKFATIGCLTDGDAQVKRRWRVQTNTRSPQMDNCWSGAICFLTISELEFSSVASGLWTACYGMV